MTPAFPIISIYLNRGLEILNVNDPLDKITMFGLIKHDSKDCVYFDKNGVLWTSSISSANHKINFISKVLASTFYNPMISITRTWTKHGNYEIQDLIYKIDYCIDKDDDVLTQFVDAKFLKNKIRNCKDFDNILETLYNFIFKPNPKLIEENDAREE